MKSRILAALLAAAFFAPAMTGAATDPSAETSLPEVPRAQSLSGAYLAAQAAQIEGDFKIAAAYFEQALAMNPNSLPLQQEAFVTFVSEGLLSRAVDLAGGLRDDAEVGKLARVVLGTDALTRGAYDAAIKEFALEDPSEFDELMAGEMIAWADLGAGRTDEALSRLDIMEGPSWFAVFNGYQKGLMASVAGRPAVARRAFQGVLDDPEAAPTSPDVFIGAAEALARLEAREGDKKAALAAVDKGLSIIPNFDPLVQMRERIERGETIEPSVTNVREGASLALYVLAQAINRADGQQFALMYLQLARGLAPQNAEVLIALAGIAERADRLDRAIEIYEAIPASSGYRRLADLQIGLDLFRADRKDEAKQHLKRATRDYPNDIQAFVALSDVMAADKEYEQVAELLNEAIRLAKEQDAETWNLYFQRGIAYERTDRWEKAEADLKKAIEMSPNQAPVLNYLAYSWIDMNENLDKGLDMIRKAVDLRPNDAYIIDSLGWAYYRLGRYEEAVEELERAVLIMPTDPTVNDHLGDAYWRVGREREARYQWERALVGDPEPEPDVVREIQAKLENGLQPRSQQAEREENAQSGTPIAVNADRTAPEQNGENAPAADATDGNPNPAAKARTDEGAPVKVE